MGEIVVSADDLPYFLYDQSLADKNNPLAGFLRSQFLLRVSAHLVHMSSILTLSTDLQVHLHRSQLGQQPRRFGEERGSSSSRRDLQHHPRRAAHDCLRRCACMSSSQSPDRAPLTSFTQARFTLNSQTSWSRRDSDFLAPVFFKRIVDAFKAKKFARETLAWWDM